MDRVYVWYMPLQEVKIVMGVNKTYDGALNEIEKWWRCNLLSYRFSCTSPVDFNNYIDEFKIGE